MRAPVSNWDARRLALQLPDTRVVSMGSRRELRTDFGLNIVSFLYSENDRTPGASSSVSWRNKGNLVTSPASLPAHSFSV